MALFTDMGRSIAEKASRGNASTRELRGNQKKRQEVDVRKTGSGARCSAVGILLHSASPISILLCGVSVVAQAKNFENHSMYVPAFHFVAIPIFTLNVGWSIYRVAHVFSGDTVIALLVAVALLLLAFNARIFALKVQDRVIRLEMHHAVLHLQRENP